MGDFVPLSMVGGIGMMAVDVVRVDVPEVTGLEELAPNGPVVATVVVGVVTVVVVATVGET